MVPLKTVPALALMTSDEISATPLVGRSNPWQGLAVTLRIIMPKFCGLVTPSMAISTLGSPFGQRTHGLFIGLVAGAVYVTGDALVLLAIARNTRQLRAVVVEHFDVTPLLRLAA